MSDHDRRAAGRVRPIAPRLELWRTGAGDIVVFANGAAISNGASHADVFDVSGTSFDQMGTSQWDDVGFEYTMCRGLPTAEQRAATRNYLNVKWRSTETALRPRGGGAEAP